MNKKVVYSLLVGMAVFLVAGAAFAADPNPDVAAAANADVDKWLAIATGFGIAIAAFGGALGQGRTAATALEGIARNPGAADKMFTPMILGLALIESLVIYSLIISFLLQGKIQ
jgi:F-type H+-transporting ATPase subunit c